MSSDVTIHLERLRAGDESARSELMPLVYQELHSIASRRLAQEHSPDLMQTTALINEAYVRMLGANELVAKDRVHFFALAAKEMQRVLADQVRSRLAAKRGRGPLRVDWDDAYLVCEDNLLDFLIIDEALSDLEKYDARQCNVVRLRYFADLSEKEIATLLDVSEKTVKREWQHAKVWLRSRLESADR